MAGYLVNILGESLYRECIQDDEKHMPSPMSLKGKILVKAKRLPSSADGDADDNEDDDVDDERDDSKKKKSMVKGNIRNKWFKDVLFRKSPRSSQTW